MNPMNSVPTHLNRSVSVVRSTTSLSSWLRSYGIEVPGDLSVYSEPGSPVPIVRSAVIQLTPEMAENLLSRRGEGQRDKTRAGVEAYEHDVGAGVWSLHHQGMLVDEHMNLFDGQHRCHAVRRAGKSIWTMITQIPGANMGLEVDRGVKRRPAFVVSGQVARDPISNREISVVRGLRDALAPQRSGVSPTPSENREVFELFKSDLRAGVFEPLIWNRTLNVPAAVVSALVYAFPVAGATVEKLAVMYGRMTVPDAPHPLRALLEYLEANPKYYSPPVLRMTLNCISAAERGVGLVDVDTGIAGYKLFSERRRKLSLPAPDINKMDSIRPPRS